MTSSTGLRFFSAQDANPHALDGERVVVIGFGNLGRAIAHNLRDSGVERLVIGNIADEYAQQAHAEGFQVLPIDEAVAAADVAFILIPDEVIPEVFEADIAPNLAAGSAILFASGYNLAYGLIHPPNGVDVLLLAPRMGGELARERFLNKQGYIAYVSVEQEASGKALKRLLGMAYAVGVLYAGALELDAKREADLDLLVEQTVGAALGVAIMSAYNLGVEAGIPPEAMVLEMYMDGEMETVFRTFRDKGFYRASYTHGPTAMYGGYVRTMQLMQSDLVAKFRETMDEIRNGAFAQQFQDERSAGYPSLTMAEQMASGDNPFVQPVFEAEARVRAALKVS